MTSGRSVFQHFISKHAMNLTYENCNCLMDKTLSARTFFSTDCSHTSSRRETNNTRIYYDAIDLYMFYLYNTSHCTFTLTSRKECSRPKLNGKELLTSLYGITLSLQAQIVCISGVYSLQMSNKEKETWRTCNHQRNPTLLIHSKTLVKFPPEVCAICQLNFTKLMYSNTLLSPVSNFWN